MKKREPVPASYHMTIAEMKGRYYPLRIAESPLDTPADTAMHLAFPPQLQWEWLSDYSTPYAVGKQPTNGIVSFPTYHEALNFCHRYQEDIALGIEWEWKNAHIEWYPERNIWYLEEIYRLTHDRVSLYTVGGVAYAGTFRKAEYCCVHRPTMDEAITALYELVSQVVQQQSLV